jgi:hypothetical protein
MGYRLALCFPVDAGNEQGLDGLLKKLWQTDSAISLPGFLRVFRPLASIRRPSVPNCFFAHAEMLRGGACGLTVEAAYFEGTLMLAVPFLCILRQLFANEPYDLKLKSASCSLPIWWRDEFDTLSFDNGDDADLTGSCQGFDSCRGAPWARRDHLGQDMHEVSVGSLCSQ